MAAHNPTRRGPMLERALGVGALLLGIASAYGTFFVAQPDRVQGDAARIVYFHVPMAWVAFLAFFVVFVASIAYLWTRASGWDRLGRASAEVGVLFTTLVLVTGSIWGYPVWGTWWTWDPKLTTTLVLWFLYLGYLMVRSYADPPHGPRFAAVLGILGFFDVPIVYMSSVWWRALHPSPEVGPLAAQQPSTSMQWLLLLSVLAFTILYAYLTAVRIRVEALSEQVAALRDTVDQTPSSETSFTPTKQLSTS